MFHSVALGVHVMLVVRLYGHHERFASADDQTMSFETDEFLGVVGQQNEAFDAEVAQDLCADAVFSEVGCEAQLGIGVLKFVLLLPHPCKHALASL